MQQGVTQREAVRLAREELGDVPSAELAAYIQGTFGLAIQPAIVSVIVGTFKEREALERTGRAVRERIEQWKAENPEQARKQAAAAKRKEALAKRKAAESQNPLPGAGASPAAAPDITPVAAESEPETTLGAAAVGG